MPCPARIISITSVGTRPLRFRISNLYPQTNFLVGHTDNSMMKANVALRHRRSKDDD